MNNETISIAGLDKAEVFRALYNNAKPQGLGFLHFTPEDMTIEEAREYVQMEKQDDLTTAFSRHPSLFFDYVKGRVMKVDLSGDVLKPWGYDRDNGPGAAKRAIDSIR